MRVTPIVLDLIICTTVTVWISKFECLCQILRFKLRSADQKVNLVFPAFIGRNKHTKFFINDISHTESVDKGFFVFSSVAISFYPKFKAHFHPRCNAIICYCFESQIAYSNLPTIFVEPGCAVENKKHCH